MSYRVGVTWLLPDAGLPWMKQTTISSAVHCGGMLNDVIWDLIELHPHRSPSSAGPRASRAPRRMIPIRPSFGIPGPVPGLLRSRGELYNPVSRRRTMASPDIPHVPLDEPRGGAGSPSSPSRGRGGLRHGVQSGVNSNFTAQEMSLTPLQQGLLEGIRETCGITALGVLALFGAVAEPVLGAAMRRAHGGRTRRLPPGAGLRMARRGQPRLEPGAPRLDAAAAVHGAGAVGTGEGGEALGQISAAGAAGRRRGWAWRGSWGASRSPSARCSRSRGSCP